MAKPSKHIFVCTQNRPADHPRGSCMAQGCAAVMDEFIYQLHSRNLTGEMIVTHTGCLGPCGFGAVVLVYPEGIMYSKVTQDDVVEICEHHLLANRVVERLLMPADIWS
ncbi:MAG: (2Fe-2S) ferredoxin domain-containing protein [Pseudomonadota bacterium]|nr:(2Fe-2S) ferredoxin domain-containing protein [Pseudomonadota bacterium]